MRHTDKIFHKMEISKQLPRDVFLYLLMIVALGMSAVNFGTLLFQFINLYVPDALNTAGYDYSGSYLNTIRWTLASIIVAFPVLVWVTRFLKRDIIASPEKRDLRIRKWLIYLTLFVAGVVVLGDLIALVYSFLQGELTLRFALKIASILLVSGSVFWYYLREIREAAPVLFGRIISTVVVAAVVVGFFVAGSPQSQRLVRFDQERINNLQTIQWQVVSYWQNKRVLPVKLDDLKDDISGFVAPVDPETRVAYEYKATGALSFRLCSEFKTQYQAAGGRAYEQPVIGKEGIASNWDHAIGKVCFDRTIDPDFFPPRQQ